MTDHQAPLACPYALAGTPDKTTGWTFQPAAQGETVYIPFEGYYESKGGRVQSPRIRLNKPQGKNAFFRLRFTAIAKVQGYWWIDFFDADGNPLPDINSALYASAVPLPYEEVFCADPRAESAVIAFVTQEGVSVKDISLEMISTAEAADWCDRLYATLPPLNLPPADHAFQLLPRTLEAIRTGRPWNILMLGDSIVNDTWTSNYQALVLRDLPKADLTFRISVRGSTGCWYYQEPEHFREYVANYAPDLVMIGGISNTMNADGPDDPQQNMVSVIRQCQKLGSEVLVMSPPPSWEWRENPEYKTWDENWQTHTGFKPNRRDYQRAATQSTNTAYWDLTTAPVTLIDNAHKPLDWFRRDVVHNNDRGKQLIGQNLAHYFRNAGHP